MSVNFCGLECDKCKYRSMCKGCCQSGGAPFWGKCEIACCCQKRDLRHCGECDKFACDRLKAFAFDPVQGDQGRRIEHLEMLRQLEER